MLQRDSVYGFANHEDVAKAIERRLSAASADKKDVLARLLGEAVEALEAINEKVPVQSKYRYLVADALEKFANGS